MSSNNINTEVVVAEYFCVKLGAHYTTLYNSTVELLFQPNNRLTSDWRTLYNSWVVHMISYNTSTYTIQLSQLSWTFYAMLLCALGPVSLILYKHVSHILAHIRVSHSRHFKCCKLVQCATYADCCIMFAWLYIISIEETAVYSGRCIDWWRYIQGLSLRNHVSGLLLLLHVTLALYWYLFQQFIIIILLYTNGSGITDPATESDGPILLASGHITFDYLHLIQCELAI